MADSFFGFSGLSSGVQWRDMVDQLMALEARPITNLQKQIATLESRSKAWGDVRSRIEGLRTATKGLADATAFRTFSSSISEATAGAAGFSLTAGSGASPGSYSVRVLGTAAREKLGSDYVSSRSEALGHAGDFLVNGTAVTVEATHTLDDVAQQINGAKAGVTASVLSVDGSYRLVLTSASTGGDGIELVDGGGDVLRGLGLLSTESGALKHLTSNGVRSDTFESADTAVATLLGLGGPGTETVTINGVGVQVDLGAMSLNDLAAALDGVGGASVSVVAGEDGEGYRLEIAGTTDVEGDATTVEMLGLREAGRGTAARVIQSADLGAVDGATTLGALQAANGDTLTITGTTGDGTAFSTSVAIAVGTAADTDLDDVLAAINAKLSEAGSSAQATLEGGRVVLTDAANGQNGLSLQITANNENGGSLDFGDFTAVQDGYARTMIAGRDAEFMVDGVRFTRASNAVTDVIEGSTLTLTRAGEAHEVSINQDAAAVTASVKAFVDKYNGLLDHVASQSSYPEGGSRPALHGDSWLRGIRTELNAVMQSVLPAGVTDRSRLATVGIEIQRDGRFAFDAAKLESALAADPTSVERLFGEAGFTSTSRLGYVGASKSTAEGTWAVNVQQAAALATATGATTASTTAGGSITIRDAGTGASYQMSFVPATPLASLAQQISDQLADARSRELLGSTTFYADDLGTVGADATTRLDSLYQDTGAGAAAAAVQVGDVLTLSGTTRTGTAFTTEYTVGADDTLGDVQAAVQEKLGTGVTVAIEAGRFVLTDNETGTSALSLSITSSSTDPGALSFGTFGVVEEGRPAARIDAAVNAAGQLVLTHQDYGSAAGFSVSYSDATAEADVGIAAGDYAGLDVIATIGAETVTGSGRILTGPADTDIAGLILEYEGATAGDLGTVTFSRGIGARLDRVFDRLLGSDTGSIQARMTAADDRVPTIERRIDDMEARLENRREALIRRFVAMEQAMALAQSQSSWLASQINGLAGYSSNGGG